MNVFVEAIQLLGLLDDGHWAVDEDVVVVHRDADARPVCAQTIETLNWTKEIKENEMTEMNEGNEGE
jgi:hypothetical protein